MTGRKIHRRTDFLGDGIYRLIGEAEKRAACIDEASEFSWGKGLVPRRFEDAPPSEGGMYKGKAPPEKAMDVTTYRDRRF